MEGGETVTHRLSLVMELSLWSAISPSKWTGDHLLCSLPSLLDPLIGQCKSANRLCLLISSGQCKSPGPPHFIWSSPSTAATNEPNIPMVPQLKDFTKHTQTIKEPATQLCCLVFWISVVEGASVVFSRYCCPVVLCTWWFLCAVLCIVVFLYLVLSSVLLLHKLVTL